MMTRIHTPDAIAVRLHCVILTVYLEKRRKKGVTGLEIRPKPIKNPNAPVDITPLYDASERSVDIDVAELAVP